VSLNVGLSCPASSPLSGATLSISGEGGTLNHSVSKTVTTDFRDLGEATYDLGPSSKPYDFKANYVGGTNGQHDAATAATGFFIDEK